MNLKTNSAILIIVAIMIIIFTESIGINMKIALNYLPLFFAVITIIFYNLKLKEKIDKKRLIIINIIIIGANYVLTKFIKGTFGYTSILAVLIFCKLIDRNENLKSNKLLIKSIIVYYIIPLVILLGIDVGYTKLLDLIFEYSDYWMVNYNFFAMDTIFQILTADIVMTMLVIEFKEIIESKININKDSKKIMIYTTIIIAVILCVKIIIGCIGLNDANSKISKLNSAIQSNDLNTYFELDVDPKVKIEDANKIQQKYLEYMFSFNRILTKGVSNWSELFYKSGTTGMEKVISRRNISKKGALERYNESAQSYIERLNIYKGNLHMQNVSNIIIYAMNFICVFIVYKKVAHKKDETNEDFKVTEENQNVTNA